MRFSNAFVCMILAVVFGCVTRPGSGDPRVSVGPDVTKKVYVLSHRMVDGENGYRTFRATVVNDCPGERPVEWRVVWLDAEGRELEMAASGWNRVMLVGGGETQLKNTATRTEAVDYRFHLRRARD